MQRWCSCSSDAFIFQTASKQPFHCWAAALLDDCHLGVNTSPYTKQQFGYKASTGMPLDHVPTRVLIARCIMFCATGHQAMYKLLLGCQYMHATVAVLRPSGHSNPESKHATALSGYRATTTTQVVFVMVHIVLSLTRLHLACTLLLQHLRHITHLL